MGNNNVQEGDHTSTSKRDNTLIQLHELDANQTASLMQIGQDLVIFIANLKGICIC